MNIRIINRGDKVRRNFILREKGWSEPTIENKNPHIGDNIANRRNKIRILCIRELKTQILMKVFTLDFN